MVIQIGRSTEAPEQGVDYYTCWREFQPGITVWKYARRGPNAMGAILHPKESLQSKFREYFLNSNCEWFIPYVNQMANGKRVTVEEIIEAYRANNNGVHPEILDK